MKKTIKDLTSKEIVTIKYADYKRLNAKKAGEYDAETKTIPVYKRIYNLVKINVKTRKAEDSYQDVLIKLFVEYEQFEDSLSISSDFYIVDEEYRTSRVETNISKALKTCELELVEENVEITQEDIDSQPFARYITDTVEQLYFK